MNPVLSHELKTFLEEFVPEHVEELVESYSKPLPETFRVNTLKTSVDECIQLLKEEEGVEARPVEWLKCGFYAEPPGRLSSSLWHMLGLIYMQGPVSMLVAELLDVEPGHKVLDLCAAPGSKSTHIAQKLEGKGVLIANDISRTRVKALSSNLQRCGAINSIISLADGRRLGWKLQNFFDRVLVDAPCSSLGVGARHWNVLNKWSQRYSERLGALQRSLLFSGYMGLKPSGILVYATCTFHPLENEAVVSELLERFEDAVCLETHVEGLSFSRGVEEWRGWRFNEGVKKTLRVYPHQTGAEGFYIAKITKQA
ncbi:MAG: RsmB/NOP family class I SAM-dependent RNA methyltransferase [Candidatus Caldarchaeum sp.]|nr:RsmB/NOP family class I SAM-dependent RNA methyltransferase [Candidatus Caldarchaeum sp.]